MQNSKQVSRRVWSTKKSRQHHPASSVIRFEGYWRGATSRSSAAKHSVGKRRVFFKKKLLPTRTTGNVQYFCCILRRIPLTVDKELPLCWTGNSAEIRSLCFQAKSPPQKTFSIGISLFILSVCDSVWKTAKFYCILHATALGYVGFPPRSVCFMGKSRKYTLLQQFREGPDVPKFPGPPRETTHKKGERERKGRGGNGGGKG